MLIFRTELLERDGYGHHALSPRMTIVHLGRLRAVGDDMRLHPGRDHVEREVG